MIFSLLCGASAFPCHLSGCHRMVSDLYRRRISALIASPPAPPCSAASRDIPTGGQGMSAWSMGAPAGLDSNARHRAS